MVIEAGARGRWRPGRPRRYDPAAEQAERFGRAGGSMTADTAFLDGNAAAGALGEVFGFDVTAATGRCAACGSTASLAQARLYSRGPGLVVRCAECEAVLLRLVDGPGRGWLDLRGLAYLQFTRAE